MKAGVLTSAVVALILWAAPVFAQGQVEVTTPKPAPEKGLVIIGPGPAAKEATRARESDFYGEDVRVRHDPAFLEPFAGETQAGNRYGLSGWTSPATPVGSAQSRAESGGWFAVGFSFTWDAPPKPASTKPR